MSHFKLIIVSLFVLALAGCTSQTLPDPDPSETTYGDDTSSGADTDGYGSDGLDSGEFIDYDPSAGELANILYFEFDSSELRADDTETVSRHARQLAENTSLRVRLEGHADERGSREYNIGLGERRSQTVRRMLLIQGAAASQISTVSFGEERPAEFGNTEDAYSKNRRVEITYTN
ncbi:MAG: peptidoglycan-associated lipoprotein Pal [Desulfobulbaceae bacterium]|nr:peptidoglycan-associated lipoprotein Pal [Desulfobulbaceae bacterium]